MTTASRILSLLSCFFFSRPSQVEQADDVEEDPEEALAGLEAEAGHGVAGEQQVRLWKGQKGIYIWYIERMIDSKSMGRGH